MEDSSAAAQRLLLKADKILASVDEAFIITIRNHKPRLIPAFRPEEISLGRLLGIGGFGIVHEITKFTLDLDVEVDVEREGDCSRHDDNDDNDGDDEDPLGRRGVEGVQTGMTDPIELSLSDTHVHYDFSKARRWMENRCNRNGVARYALKSLQKNLSEVEQARGMVDLAVEAKYLSVVWHPNISK